MYYVRCVSRGFWVWSSLSWQEAFVQILTCLIWALWKHVTYLFTKRVTKSCDSPDWLAQYRQVASSPWSRVTEPDSVKNVFKNDLAHKIWSVYGQIPSYLSLSWFCYQRWPDVSTDGLFIVIYCLLLFNVGVLSNAYRVLTQTRHPIADSSIMWESRLRRQEFGPCFVIISSSAIISLSKTGRLHFHTGKCIRRFAGIYAYCRYFIDRKW